MPLKALLSLSTAGYYQDSIVKNLLKELQALGYDSETAEQDLTTLINSTFLILHFTKTERGICASKAKTVGYCNIYFSLLGCFGNIIAIEIFWRIAWVFQIQCWRKSVLLALAITHVLTALAHTLT